MIYVLSALAAGVLAAMNMIRAYTKTRSADKIFTDSGWAGHQLGIMCFDDLTDEQWAHKIRSIVDNFEDHRDTAASLRVLHDCGVDPDRALRYWVRNTFARSPRQQDTFKVRIFESVRRIVFVANHAVCDGQVLYDILSIILDIKTPIKLPVYYRVFVLSELMVLKYVTTHFIRAATYTPLPIHDTNIRMAVPIPYKGEGRYDVYAKIFTLLFSVLDESTVHTLRVALTVAWDDPLSPVHNRIGCIIVDIPRDECQPGQEDRCSRFIRRRIMRRRCDALTSYEVMRSYNVPYFRSKFCHSVDAVMTTFKLPWNCTAGMSRSFGGFCGNLTAPLYINAITTPRDVDPVVNLSVQSCTPCLKLDRVRALDRAMVFTYDFPSR